MDLFLKNIRAELFVVEPLKKETGFFFYKHLVSFKKTCGGSIEHGIILTCPYPNSRTIVFSENAPFFDYTLVFI